MGGKDAAAQGSMAGGAQARALACGAAGMPDGGRAPVAGRIDAQRRPEEASAGVSCLPRPSDIFETRATVTHSEAAPAAVAARTPRGGRTIRTLGSYIGVTKNLDNLQPLNEFLDTRY